jgi:hypothetical protein
MSVSSYDARLSIIMRAKSNHPERLEAARRLLTALAVCRYDEMIGGVAGLLTLGSAWLGKHQLAALACVKFKPAYALPGDVAADLRRACYLAVADAELHRGELVTVLRTLAEHHIIPVVFKGAVLAHTVYPDLACRQMTDIDLWVTDEEMPHAQAALEAIGYRYVSKPERPLAIMRIDMGEVQMHGPTGDTGLVELHWGVFAGEWLRRAACVDEGAIRSRVAAITVLGQAALTLAPEDAMIQIAIHAAVNHQMSLAALRSLMDIALLARAQPIDWRSVADRARAWRVATAMWLVLSLTRELCGLDEAAEAVKRLAPSCLRQKMLGVLVNAESLVNMRDLSKSRWRYVYLLLLVDRARDAAKLIYRTLWPEGEWLAARYGSDATTGSRTGIGVRLRHLVNAARGRI